MNHARLSRQVMGYVVIGGMMAASFVARVSHPGALLPRRKVTGAGSRIRKGLKRPRWRRPGSGTANNESQTEATSRPACANDLLTL